MKYYLSVRARADALNIFSYLAQETSTLIADEFLLDLQETLELLGEFPQMGTKRTYGNHRLTGTRMFPLKKFKNFVVFFKRTNREIEIVRIFHGARDVPTLFS